MQKDIRYLDSQLRRFSGNQILMSSLLLLILITATGYLSGYKVAFSIFFLIPITLATWYGNRHQGFFLCALSATACLFLESKFQAYLYSNPFAPYWNAVIQLGFFLIIAQLLASVKKHLHIERQLSRTDTLTGVMTGREFTEASQHLLTLAARHGRPAIFAYIELDNLKQMNDAFGQSEGNKALQVIGQVFLESMRKTDIVGRLCEDGFSVLLPETDAIGARTKLGKLKNELTQEAKNHNWPIGFNIGFISFGLSLSGMDEVFEIASTLMSQVKKNGKNNTIFEHFPSDMNSALQA